MLHLLEDIDAIKTIKIIGIHLLFGEQSSMTLHWNIYIFLIPLFIKNGNNFYNSIHITLILIIVFGYDVWINLLYHIFWNFRIECNI